MLPPNPSAMSDLALVFSGFRDFLDSSFGRKSESVPAAKPPISSNGDALFSFVNDSGKPSSSVFVQVIARDPATGKDFFVKYAEDGTYERSFATAGEDSKPFAYPVSHFSDGSLYLPVGDGARMYVSVDSPITFMVNTTINAPDAHNPSDPSNLVLWDKIEFNVSKGAVFVNPTAVDSFALPLRVREDFKDGGHQAGGVTEKRSAVFDAFSKAFTEKPWKDLLANEGRVAFSPTDGAQVGVLFPRDHLKTTGWLDAFYDVFSKRDLVVDMDESFPPRMGGGIWRGRADSFAKHVTFRRDVDASHPVTDPVVVGIPEGAQDWLSGTGDDWLATDDLERAIVRNVASAFETNTLFTDQPLGKKYFDSVRSRFYETDPNAPASLNFPNLYSKVLHGFGDGHVYSFAYDDELDQSGAASCPPSNFASGSVTLGPL